jgi:hypothetical protein
MAESAIYVVQICCDKAGVRALVRAAASATTEEFTSADGLWRFLVSGEDNRSGTDQATPEQRPPS